MARWKSVDTGVDLAFSNSLVASDIGWTPASSAKMPRLPLGRSESNLTFKCEFLTALPLAANSDASDL